MTGVQPEPIRVGHGVTSDSIELARQAAVFGRHLVLVGTVHSAIEFLEALTQMFGAGVRLYYGEVVALLEVDEFLTPELRALVRSQFASDPLKPKRQRESTLDELFSRIQGFKGSPRYLEALRFVARIKEYAPFNNMLVFLQRPLAVYFASATDWQKRFQRRVKDEAIPIVILQPMGPVMLVYELADTTGPEVPAHVLNPFAVQGVYKAIWQDRLVNEARSDGIEVRGARLGGRLAGRAAKEPKATRFVIELNRDQKDAERFVTLCHELAHIYLGHLGPGVRGGWPSRVGLRRSAVELEAESVAHLVATRLGLQTLSVEYLAGYASTLDDFSVVSVEMVTKVAGRLERATGGGVRAE